MKKNILLTSLDALTDDRTLRYYSARKEFGSDYCEALQSMEAAAKYILAHFPIDEILVIGEDASAGDGKPIRLREAAPSTSNEPGALSPFDLYRSRLSQYINELSQEQQVYEALLPEAERIKLTDFIRGFQEQRSGQEPKRLNRFFDELACSPQLYAQFKDALFTAFPEAQKDSGPVMKWVKNYLYTQLKPTAKLEILPVNENIQARYIPSDMLENREYWFSSVLNVDQGTLNGSDEINLYIALSNDAAVGAHLVLNMLDILIATPGSNVHLKKIYSVSESSGNLAGVIGDSTAMTRSTDLVAAAHAFLNYSKTDMLVNFWESSGERDERISRLIYAARHVDIGISMCNIPEVQQGIQLLRGLLTDEQSWTDSGDYGLLFGLIGGCILADYSAMIGKDGNISFIELIKWAYKHQLYQQVLTLVESHAPAYLVNTGIFYYCDDEERKEEIIRLLALQRLELKPYEYYKMDDIEHYFVKSYDRAGVRLSGSKGEDRNLAYAILRAQSIEKPDPDKISGHTVCDRIDTVQNVLYAYFHLGEVRNKISHADSTAMAEWRPNVSDSDLSYAMVVMRESIEFFISSYEKALAEVQGKNPTILAISPDDVRNAANRMKHDRDHDDRRQPFRDKR